MSGATIKAVAACIRDSFAEGLDEGVSMHIARRIAALPDEAAAPSPTAARREAVRQSIIRQISDNGPDLDQTKLPAADWNVVLASLGSPAPFEDRVDTVWSLLVEAGDEGLRYTAEKIVEALSSQTLPAPGEVGEGFRKPATPQEGNKSFASWSTETLAQQCRMQGRDQLDPEFSGFLAEVADRLAALATQSATSQEAQQQARAGTHLLKKAREDGWVDDGEGAYEYIVRRAYEAGMRYSTAATPTPPTLATVAAANDEGVARIIAQEAVDIITDLIGPQAAQSGTNCRVVEDHLRQFARSLATSRSQHEGASS